jgi:hypothetical protein
MIGDPDTVRDLLRSVGVACKRVELAELRIAGIVYTAVIDRDVLAAVLVEQDGGVKFAPETAVSRVWSALRKRRHLEPPSQSRAGEVVIATEIPPQAPTPVPTQVSVLAPYDQARVAKWVKDRLIHWDRSCWHCRKPIVVGQAWLTVSNGEVSVRFHKNCHAEWRAEREKLARTALGLTETT